MITPKGRQIISDIILSPFRGSGFLSCLCRGFHPCLWYAVPVRDFFFNELYIRANRLHVEGVILQPKNNKNQIDYGSKE